MPYKSDTLKINNKELDKRVKLTEEDKNKIKTLHEKGVSMRGLAKEFKVSRTLIKTIVDPVAKEKRRLYSIEYSRNLRERTKEDVDLKKKRNEQMTKHRKYKRNLHEKGLI